MDRPTSLKLPASFLRSPMTSAARVKRSWMSLVCWDIDSDRWRVEDSRESLKVFLVSEISWLMVLSHSVKVLSAGWLLRVWIWRFKYQASPARAIIRTAASRESSGI